MNLFMKSQQISVVFILLLFLTACGLGKLAEDDQNIVSNGGEFSIAAKTGVIAAGDEVCINGGVLVETGIDENGNGLLDDDEVDSSEKVCNGEDGDEGEEGQDGNNGIDGLNSLVSLSQESPGTNCQAGGIKVEAGKDSNRNDVLDSNEVSDTEYLCNPNNGIELVTGTISGDVIDYNTGTPIEGAVVTAGGVTTSSSSDGTYTLNNVPIGNRISVSSNAVGYSTQAKITSLVDSENVSITLVMIPVTYSMEFSPSQSQDLVESVTGAGIAFAANVLETENGNTPNGNVSLNLTVIDPSQDPDIMPGDFRALVNSLTLSSLESFGAIAISMIDSSGENVNLKGGSTGTIRIPLSDKSGSPPASIPLYYYDTNMGAWIEEGTATLDSSGANPVYVGSVPRFRIWNADRVMEQVSVTGCVVNADGAVVENARVQTVGDDYIGTSNANSDTNGNFSVLAKSNASVLVYAEVNGSKTNTIKINTGATEFSIENCLTFGNQSISVTLTWGNGPSDLDSHLVGPDYHIYFANKGQLDVAPFAQLDVDDVSSFGPEVITISQLSTPGTYTYSVYNFSQSFDPGITGSPTRVELNNNGSVSIFTPPSGEGSNLTWDVFEIVVNESGSITVNPLNQWSATAP